jgi:hypothetical protein
MICGPSINQVSQLHSRIRYIFLPTLYTHKLTLALNMASIARPYVHDLENQHHRVGPPQDQDEDWSDSASDEQPQQNQSPQRTCRLRHRLPQHYRQHTSELASQFPSDSYIRQARNATVPYTLQQSLRSQPLSLLSSTFKPCYAIYPIACFARGPRTS